MAAAGLPSQPYRAGDAEFIFLTVLYKTERGTAEQIKPIRSGHRMRPV